MSDPSRLHPRSLATARASTFGCAVCATQLRVGPVVRAMVPMQVRIPRVVKPVTPHALAWASYPSFEPRQAATWGGQATTWGPWAHAPL